MPDYLIISLSILIAAAGVACAVFVIMRGYSDDISKAEGDLATLALTLQERTDAVFRSIENTLRDVIAKIPADSLKADEFEVFAGSKATKTLLADASNSLPQIIRINLINARGRVVGSSIPGPISGSVYLRDTSYYRALSMDPSLLLYLSEPIRIEATGKRVISLARKINDTDGNFIGIISSTIDLAHLEKLYGDHLKTSSQMVTLYRRDGIILAHSPSDPKTLGRKVWLANTPLQRMAAKNTSTLIRDVSWIDGRERMFALHPLANYPGGIVVSRTVAELMAGRRLEARLARFIASIIDIVMDTASLFGLKQVRTGILRAASESYLAHHDILTKLPNRQFFADELKRTVSATQRSGTGFALHLLDLTRFKDINDNYGYAVGDEIVKIVSRRLRERIKRSDFIARIGGDEFAILQRPLKTQQQAVDFVSNVQGALKVPCSVAGTEIEVGLSIGVAVATASTKSASEIMRAADIALYEAKTDPDNSYRLYNASMRDTRAERRALEGALRNALENKELELHYQPILDLKTNKLWGCEALLRWNHPTKGLVSPLLFIPTAEETGLIGPIGDWILKEACTTAMTWDAPLKVAVNLSTVQFQRRDVYASVTEALEASGLPAQRLVLEITESVKLTEEAASTLKRLKALGVSISLDDFGTGYASMSYLRSFPFDKIKIDQSFVRGMLSSSDSSAIIKATISLANDLNMTTTAEGVETDEQLNALRHAGASQAQGYLIAKPMPREAVAAFMAQTLQAGSSEARDVA